MYFYNIGYNSYEECPDVTLCHEKQYTRDEIEEIIIKAIRELIPLRKFDYSYQSNFGDILMGHDPKQKNVIELLCEKYGFMSIKYTAQFSAFGWASIFDKEDWRTDSESLNKIRDGVMDLKPQPPR